MMLKLQCLKAGCPNFRPRVVFTRRTRIDVRIIYKIEFILKLTGCPWTELGCLLVIVY